MLLNACIMFKSPVLAEYEVIQPNMFGISALASNSICLFLCISPTETNSLYAFCISCHSLFTGHLSFLVFVLSIFTRCLIVQLDRL